MGQLKFNLSRLLLVYHIAIATLALVACILYVSSTSIATKQEVAVPFHLDSKTNLKIERALLPAFVCLIYIITSIPIPAPQTPGPFQEACKYAWKAQQFFLTAKYFRALILVYLALHLAFKSFIVLQEIAIYGFVGKVVSVLSRFLPKAVCATDESDNLCDVYKGAAWAALVLSALVIIDVVIVDKNREELEEHEKTAREVKEERASGHGSNLPMRQV
ncbi:MAG: hypothetical protein J3Q66DRAFT_343279 [Benniella sp.]|nr:MAG: hypothetical protein J3Q66DRAFT_343279 [Benniella sp.]